MNLYKFVIGLLLNMRRFSVAILCLILSISLNAQMKWNSKYQAYIDKYKDLAISEMLKYNIPASITLAQGLLESGAGMSELTRKGNNHFGIKCHDWSGATTYHDDDEEQECFRAYRDAYESYEDHSKFLARQPRYKRLFSLKRTDYKGWAHGLKKCGYATNPNYANKLIGIIELYKLHKYDNAKKFDKFMVERSEVKDISPDINLHPIHIYNKNYYLNARQGDTFKSISKEVGISYRKLAKYNERDKNDKLIPGEIIYLKKKQKKADKIYKKRPHRVKAGESMYSIAQYYGIRLSSLYKMNKLSPDYSIKVGDYLRVR
ncbi:n-acetylmuramoyl-L-alanine amidase family 4 [Prevotella sp. CAG:1185]|nr:n-acetylmuramoyl-L-alanine amidase family 4 [Prevotella sp. CAG:1185]